MKTGSTARWRIPGLLIIVLAITIVTYSRTLTFGFVYDDVPQVSENELIQSWPGWSAIFSRHEWTHVFPGQTGKYFRPVSLLWRVGNYALFGPDPFWWHMTSVGLHAAVTCLTYFVALALARARFIAGATALLFGVHPVHIESVAWITGVIDPLVALFFLASFLAYLQARCSHGIGLRRCAWQTVSVALCVLALLTKEIAVMLPAVVFVHGWLFATGNESPGERSFGARLWSASIEAAPYVGATAVYLLLRAVVLGGVTPAASAVGIWPALLTLPSLLWFYATHLMLPVGLSEFYNAEYVTTFSIEKVALPMLALTLVGVALVQWGRRSPLAGFAAAWMVLPLVPALALPLLPYEDFIHDRFLYLPSLGFCMLLALALARLPQGHTRAFGLPVLPMLATVALVLPLALATAHQSQQWKDDLHLFRRGVAVAPNNHVAANNLATVMLRRGEYREALRLYETVVARHPRAWRSIFSLGQVHYNLGQFEEAEKLFERAIGIDDREADQFLLLGFARMRRGRFDEAESAFRDAIAKRPQAPGYHYALGNLLEMRNRLAEALQAFSRELQIDPSQTLARSRMRAIERAMQQTARDEPSGIDNKARDAGDEPSL